MTTTLVDLRQRRQAGDSDVSGLQAYLAQLVGEPFQFARVSYGDELTLHFGDLRPGRSARSAKKYGAYVVGLRGSPWLLKSGSHPSVVTAGVPDVAVPASLGEQLRKDDLERGGFITPGSRVLAAVPIALPVVDSFALEVRLSDGSVLFALPGGPDGADPKSSSDPEPPEVADWELLAPRGLLSAWPGLRWTFDPFVEGQPSSAVRRTV